MSLRFACACGKELQIAEGHAGRKVRCPVCQEVFRAPSPVSAKPLPATAAAVSAVPWSPAATPSADSRPAISAGRPTPPPLPPVEARDEPDDTDEMADEAPRLGPPPLPLDGPQRLPTSADAVALSLGLVNHAGEPVNDDADFFAPAPSEIGRVLSAHTTLKTTKQPWSWPARIAFLLPVFILSLVCLIILVEHKPALSWIVLPLVAGWTLLVLALTRFRHTCNYVGAQGLAIFVCGGHRSRITKREIFLFQDAVELRTGQTNMYVNGVYSGTSYFFTWFDDDGRKVHQFQGQYWTRKDLPPAKNPYRFALAAELAWSGHLSENMDTLLLDQNGLLYFSIGKKDWIRLGNGLVRLSQGGNVIELDASQIQTIGLAEGVVIITEVGGRQGWFTSQGVHRFAYKDLGNARFFLFALDKLLGVRLY